MKKSQNRDGLARAFDSVRFGDRNILNLRESLPTPADAVARLEQWLRQKQVEATEEVLVVTGRGNNSPDGVSPVREAVVRAIATLRRRNVIERYEEHTPGSFSIRLAPVRAMLDAPHRKKEKEKKGADAATPQISPANRKLLRDLSERTLEALGIKETDAFLEAEMQRHLRNILKGVPAGPDQDGKLRAALRVALDQTP
jgi:hypothetical protein